MTDTTVRVMHIWPSRGQGPVHAMGQHDYQTRCGVRPQFRHRVRDGQPDEVTCAKCLRAIARGRDYARGA